MTDLIREIAQTLGHNKLRMALTGFAVAWGIFMLIVLLSLANGIVNAFEDEMMNRDSNLLTVWGGQTDRAWRGLKDGRVITLEERDMTAIGKDRETPAILVTATISNDSVTFTAGEETITGGYDGVAPEARFYDDIKLSAGRFINSLDMKLKRRALVIEHDNAVKVFGSDSAAIGRTMTGMGLAWTVVGVYDHRRRTGNFVPFATASALAGNTGDVQNINVEIAGITTQQEGVAAEQALRNVLARRHEFDPDDENAVWIWNRFNNRLDSVSVMNLLVGAMWTIGILTLISGIVGVSNIMFVSVRERTHEIGIRRALGARPRNILTQVVLESVAVTTLFGYIGIVAGTIVMGALSAVVGDMEMMKNPSVDLATAFQVTAVLIVAGALAGLFPAIKATKVRPVEALRDE